MTRNLRLVVFFLVGCSLGGFAVASWAAVSAAVVASNNVKRVATGYMSTAMSNFQSVGTGVAFGSNFTTQVAGKTVTMPASMRMAANAPNLAVAAVRRVPLLAMGLAVAAWLAPYGLEYINGQVQKQGAATGWTAAQIQQCAATTGNIYQGTQGVACDIGFAVCASVDGRIWSVTSSTVVTCGGLGEDHFTESYVHSQTSGAVPAPAPAPVPATDADWAQVEAQPLPLPAANEIAATGEPLPLQNPAWNSPYTDVPLSDPYVDPVTGKRYQDMARVTPSADGQTARVDVTKQALNPDDTPVTNPETGQSIAPEEQADFCAKNPDVLACWDKGEPEDTDLELQDKNITLAPDSGWGASGATCPADLTRTIHGGTVVTMSWQPICQMADTFRPIVIGMAWLSAILIFMGISRRAT